MSKTKKARDALNDELVLAGLLAGMFPVEAAALVGFSPRSSYFQGLQNGALCAGTPIETDCTTYKRGYDVGFTHAVLIDPALVLHHSYSAAHREWNAGIEVPTCCPLCWSSVQLKERNVIAEHTLNEWRRHINPLNNPSTKPRADFLGELVVESAAQDPAFPALLTEAVTRRSSRNHTGNPNP